VKVSDGSSDWFPGVDSGDGSKAFPTGCYGTSRSGQQGTISPQVLSNFSHTYHQRMVSYGSDSGNPVPYSLELATNLRSQLIASFNTENPLSYQFKPTGCPQADGELRRFNVALYSYSVSKDPVIPLEHLIDGILEGENYIKYLKKLRAKSFVASFDGFFAEPDPELECIVPYQIYDIGQIFCYRYYFFWDQEDSHDEEYFFTPVPRIEDEDLERLEEVVLSLLPESVTVIPEEEVLLDLSSSKGLDEKHLMGRTEFNWKLKSDQNYFSEKPLYGKGSYIQKCPGDTRFSITLSVPHSNSVKLIEKQCAQIAQEVPWSAYIKDELEFCKRFKRFHSNSKFYFCRDMKKDGITKVRPLVRVVLKAIAKKYPHLPSVKYHSIYDGFSFEKDKVVYHPPRGVGLGMSSAITTILQSAIFKITLEDLYASERDISGNIDALFYHDDAEIGFTEDSDFHEFDEVEDLVMARYGQIKNKKKSFFGSSGVLCENYVGKFDRKDSLISYLLHLPYAAHNIAHAKDIWIQGFPYFSDTDWKPYLDKLIAFWGYEFVPYECSLPNTFGGWVPSRFNHVDTSFVLLDLSDKNLASLMLASKFHKLPYKGTVKGDQPYNSPIVKIFGTHLDYGSSKSYYNNLTLNDMGRQMRRMDRFGTKKMFWTYNLQQRHNTFIRNKKLVLSEPDLFNLYLDLHPVNDVVPPKILLEDSGFDLDNVEEGFKFPSTSTPLLSYLKFHNMDKVRDDVLPCYIPPERVQRRTKGMTVEERRDTTVHICFSGMDDYHDFIQYAIPSYRIFSSQWYDPNTVIAAVRNYYGLNCLPVGREKPDLQGLHTINPLILSWLTSKSVSSMESLISLVGLKRVLDIDVNIFAEELSIVATRKLNRLIEARRLQAKGILRTMSDVSRISEDYSVSNYSGYSDWQPGDSDYFLWTTSHNCKPFKDWRYGYFVSIRNKYFNEELRIDVGDAIGGQNENDGSANVLDVVEEHLYRASGGIIKDNKPFVNQVSAIFEENGSAHSSKESSVYDTGAELFGFG
jgi:hypothetical protein